MATTTLARPAPKTPTAEPAPSDPGAPPVPAPAEPVVPPAAAQQHDAEPTVPAAFADLVELEQALAGVAVSVGLATAAAVLQQVSRFVATSCELWWTFDHARSGRPAPVA